MFLTPDEMRDLTGYKVARAQIRWLTRNGIRHWIAATGRPVVPRSAIDGTCEDMRPDSAVVRKAHEDEIFSMPQAPWQDVGMTPDDWLQANVDRFIYSKRCVVGNSDPYVPFEGPQEGGIYFLVEGQEVIYVGQSNAIYRRLAEHWKAGRNFSRYWWFGGVPHLFIEAIEGMYINYMRPIMNTKAPILHPGVKDALQRMTRAAHFP